jgi:hypothetical protein
VSQKATPTHVTVYLQKWEHNIYTHKNVLRGTWKALKCSAAKLRGVGEGEGMEGYQVFEMEVWFQTSSGQKFIYPVVSVSPGTTRILNADSRQERKKRRAG